MYGIEHQTFDSLSDRLRSLHDRILEIDPRIERVACALYDPDQDLLKTFINSTREGEALRSYQYHLSDSESLSYLARTREVRHLAQLQDVLAPTTAHSAYVLSEGYQSSFTVPMYDGDQFLGFIFFDSKEADTFSTDVQRELTLYAQMLTMVIGHELLAVRTIVSTVHLARDFTELRDLETGAHLERMSRYARIIARGVSQELDLGDEFVEKVFLYAPLHDIGKIGVPDRVLLKPGPLDDAEWEVMRSHTTKGAEMVDHMTMTLTPGFGASSDMVRNIVELHHEAMDGSGYPHGMVGEEIPIEARIVSVADVFDALTSYRPYKAAWSVEEAVSQLWQMAADGKLDPRCVAALVDSLDEVLEVMRQFAEPVIG